LLGRAVVIAVVMGRAYNYNTVALVRVLVAKTKANEELLVGATNRSY